MVKLSSANSTSQPSEEGSHINTFHGSSIKFSIGLPIMALLESSIIGLSISFGLEKPRGAVVAKILDKSPAQKSGLKQGDVILSFNGEEQDGEGEGKDDARRRMFRSSREAV